ncbi:MAG: hypothetical protein GC162_15820 [Planctomycetes bacterium]|nr:hypothetical protein [Planctomycetota bacterium]
MTRRLIILMLLLIAAGFSIGADEPYDPMARLLNRPAPNPYDPMQSLPRLETYIDYDPMPVYARRANVPPGDPMAALVIVDAPAAPIGGELLGGLPPGDGRDTTLGLCSMCHSLQLVTQQHLTDAAWDELWVTMIKKNGMPDVGEPARTQVLTYLKQHFSAGKSK